MERGSGRIEIRGVDKRFGAVDVLHEVYLDVEPCETVALLGPSGCGKTTLLRSVAGLERIHSGSISIDGTLVSGPGVHVRPEERNIGMVFQDWALFPHMTVAENVGYGLSRDERRSTRVAETLEMVGLGGLGPRMPSTLSGGQQQRVALARALAPRPQAILLDEPFSNLDSALRVQVRTEVHRLLSELGVTTVFVTHDQQEAFVLGDRVAVMRAGVIEQHATPAEVYTAPATRWVADFVGEANFVAATAHGKVASTWFGDLTLCEEHFGPVEVLVRPEQVAVHATADGSGGVGNVELVEYYGHDHVAIVVLDDDSRLASRAPGPPQVRRGQRVGVSADGSGSVAFAST